MYSKNELSYQFRSFCTKLSSFFAGTYAGSRHLYCPLAGPGILICRKFARLRSRIGADVVYMTIDRKVSDREEGEQILTNADLGFTAEKLREDLINDSMYKI